MTKLSEKMTLMLKLGSMTNKKPKLFGELFKRLRLRAGFETLAALSKVLADYGYVYEDSTFSRWQRGNRIPASRKTIITIIKVFAENQGISTLVEANRLLESAGQGFLTDGEIHRMPKSLLEHPPFQAPPDISPFIGRDKQIEKLKEVLLHGKVALISGTAGVGKTALAIRLAHILRSQFPDGVIWSRLDTTSPMSILAKIAYTYGENINAIKDLEARAEVVRSLLFRKKAFLVFDNVQSSTNLKSLFPNAPLCSVIVTSRSKSITRFAKSEHLELGTFTPEEALELFKSKTGHGWVNTNKVHILKLSSILGYLPLALDIAASHMVSLPRQLLERYIDNLLIEKTRLDLLKMGDISLRSSFNSSFTQLSSTHQQLFTHLGVFAGFDFSVEAAASTANLDERIVQIWLEDMFDRSIVERSADSRYRLHPLIKLFAEEKIKSRETYLKALKYYSRFLKQQNTRHSLDNYPLVEKELDNILSLWQKCAKLKEWKPINEIWPQLGAFLWHSGYWNQVERLGETAARAALKLKDKQSLAACYIRELSWLYYWQGDLRKSKSFAKKGLEIAKNLNDKYLTAYAKKRLGMVSQRNGDYKKTEKILHEALEAFIKLKKLKHAGDIYLYLGHVSRKQGNLDKAKDLYRQALDTALVIRDQEGVPIAYYYLGEIALLKKQYQVAKSFFKRALAIDKEQGRKSGEAWNKWGLGLIELELSNFESAKQLFLQAKEVYERLCMRTNVKQVEKDIEKANAAISKIDKIQIFEVS